MYFLQENLDKEIIRLFYEGLTISDIAKRLKDMIRVVDNEANNPAKCRKYAAEVIYAFQRKNKRM